MYAKFHEIAGFLATSSRIAKVQLDAVNGSTPRDGGTWMLVSKSAIFRTIGGGRLEEMAIEKARQLLEDRETVPAELQVPLGPHIGQCCGGTVNLRIHVLSEQGLEACCAQLADELSGLPEVYIFGAGHVGSALARAFSLLPVVPIVIDSREGELMNLPQGIETRLSAIPEAEVAGTKPGSAVLILTHDHALDFLIAREALSRSDLAYVGMIGSKTKRATFRNWLRRENGSESGFEHLVCPIGLATVSDKRPEVIAAMTVAEVMATLNEYAIRNNTENALTSDNEPDGLVAVKG